VIELVNHFLCYVDFCDAFVKKLRFQLYCIFMSLPHVELLAYAESVREACITQLVEAWLRTYNGDRLALLVLLDIENSADVCQTLLQVLFKKSTPLALSEDLAFLNEEFVSVLRLRFLCLHCLPVLA